MKQGVLIRLFLVGLVVQLASLPQSVSACAACFGQSDSPLADGMNWGIFTLLGVIVCVLGGVAAFFIHLARKAATTPTATDSGELSAQTK